MVKKLQVWKKTYFKSKWAFLTCFVCQSVCCLVCLSVFLRFDQTFSPLQGERQLFSPSVTLPPLISSFSFLPWIQRIWGEISSSTKTRISLKSGTYGAAFPRHASRTFFPAGWGFTLTWCRIVGGKQYWKLFFQILSGISSKFKIYQLTAEIWSSWR